jgi:hypothetical protein
MWQDLKEGARIRRVARHFDGGGMATRASEEQQNSELTLKSCRFAQLRGHWAYIVEHPE